MALDDVNERLLARAKPTLTHASTGHRALHLDVFTLDNSDTKKEGVGRKYMGFDGYAPIAGYLAEEGYCLGLELRPGTKHSASETQDFLSRLLSLLVRADSGFDGAALFVALAAAPAAGPVDWLVKWSLHSFMVAALYQRFDADPAWEHPRPGEHEAYVV